MLLVVALSLLALASVPVVHEAGHALAALLVGGRRLSLVRRGLLSFALCAELPERELARRAFYAGGPLANAVAALALLVVTRAVAPAPALLVTLGGAAVVHLTFALVNLLPLAGHDGRALFCRAPERARKEPS